MVIRVSGTSRGMCTLHVIYTVMATFCFSRWGYSARECDDKPVEHKQASVSVQVAPPIDLH